MFNLRTSLVLAALVAAPVSAQIMGSVNRNAPTVEQHVKFANGGHMAISFTSLNFAEGAFVERAKDERFRNFVNSNAKDNPVGKLTLATKSTFGGKELKAGDYGIHFMVGDNAGWKLVLSHGKDLMEWPLDLQDAPMKSDRLMIAAIPASTSSATVFMHFGTKMVMVPAECSAKEKGEK